MTDMELREMMAKVEAQWAWLGPVTFTASSGTADTEGRRLAVGPWAEVRAGGPDDYAVVGRGVDLRTAMMDATTTGNARCGRAWVP